MKKGRRGVRLIHAGSVLLALAALVLTARQSSAQETSPTAREPVNPASGPLVLTPIPTTVIFSPDAKVSTVNHSTAVLTGAYVGELYDNHLFLGAGGYWLASPRTDARLFYGGFLGGWRVYGGSRLNVSAKALAGVGSGTAFVTFSADPGPRGPHARPLAIVNRRVGLSDNFFVIEPEIDVAFGVTDGIRFNIGAGYRATSANAEVNDLFRGATGTIGVEFDVGR